MVKEKKETDVVARQLTVDEKIINDGNERKFALFQKKYVGSIINKKGDVTENPVITNRLEI